MPPTIAASRSEIESPLRLSVALTEYSSGLRSVFCRNASAITSFIKPFPDLTARLYASTAASSPRSSLILLKVCSVKVLSGNSRSASAYPHFLKPPSVNFMRSEEHTSELQSRPHLVCRLLLEKKKKKNKITSTRKIS